jgi:hypothetical protein
VRGGRAGGLLAQGLTVDVAHGYVSHQCAASATLHNARGSARLRAEGFRDERLKAEGCCWFGRTGIRIRSGVVSRDREGGVPCRARSDLFFKKKIIFFLSDERRYRATALHGVSWRCMEVLGGIGAGRVLLARSRSCVFTTTPLIVGS